MNFPNGKYFIVKNPMKEIKFNTEINMNKIKSINEKKK